MLKSSFWISSYVEYRDCCSFNASYIEVTPSYRRLAETFAGGTAFCAFGVQPPILFDSLEFIIWNPAFYW